MKKKKKGKTTRMLRPEEYIRQRARKLPVFECYVNSNWKETGLANIMVSRKHTNNNITMGMYLIDIKCLGVKDALYRFNIPQFEYEEQVDKTGETLDLEKIPYTLAHNIIFAGLEFADDYGFKPVKEFTSVAQYILEEDTEDIELIEIECGQKGKPFYFQGALDSDRKANKVIAQLEKTAGTGNFEYSINAGSSDGEEDWSEQDEAWVKDMENLEDHLAKRKEKYGSLPQDQKLDIIHSLLERIETLSDEEREDLGYLSRNVIDQYIDFDRVDEIFSSLTDKLDEFEVTDENYNEMLGIQPGSDIDGEKWMNQFTDIFGTEDKKIKKNRKKLEKLKREMTENPAVYFLELHLLQLQQNPDYKEKLNEYYRRFPDYPLINILWTTEDLLDNKETNPADIAIKGPAEFFPGRKSITDIERHHYINMLFILSVAHRDLNLIEALEQIIYELKMPEEAENFFRQISAMHKLNFLLSLKEN